MAYLVHFTLPSLILHQDTVLGFIYIDPSAPQGDRPAPTPTKKSPSSRSASRSSLDSTGGSSEADLEGQMMAFEEKWTILNEWNDGRMQGQNSMQKIYGSTFGSRFQFDLVR